MKKLYIELISICKEAGVPVFHRKLIDKEGGTGCYYTISRRICIRKSLRYTLKGVYVLLHEMGHAIDHVQGHHAKFFSFGDKIRFTETRWNLIKKAEISASRRGLRTLKRIGFNLEKGQLTDSVLDIAIDPDSKISKEYLESWKREYFLV